jgi:hypothetical protein
MDAIRHFFCSRLYTYVYMTYSLSDYHQYTAVGVNGAYYWTRILNVYCCIYIKGRLEY